MFAPLRWTDVALRLALTIVVSLLIGYNRREHGKAAGMRTTLLVCLAASAAMIEVNLLLPTAGRTPSSFVMNDLMRLPLGILTGVGFIGAGAILRRGDVVIGITTAATLWLVTVIGLCLGGGQIALGLTATAIGLFALWVLKWIEDRLRQQHRARFSIELDTSGPSEADIRRKLDDAGLAIMCSGFQLDRENRHRKLEFEVHEVRATLNRLETPGFVAELAREAGVVALQWQAPI
ncbi:MAG TPA: MgtC/SapB family protein [Steroidobacteraceae bacterium]|jgi:putative Mg2+ transporter-C (MgtC) family protein|nr:MgtC/SapB family protein [Steroidobacteraceae bacterium]